MWVMKWSWILLIVPSVIANSTTYWWLGRAAFGGRNYNLEDIANNVHNQEGDTVFPVNDQSDTDSEHVFDFLNDSEELVKNSEKMDHKPNIEILVGEAAGRNATRPAVSKKKKLKRVKTRGKRQIKSREGPRLDEIETECPVTLTCTTRRVCDTRGKIRRDLIPCLHQTTGHIEVCCDTFFPSVCPEVRMLPPAENCQGELDECDTVGNFCSENHLCCFNGCKHICLEDPPLIVDTSFFFRASAEVVNHGEPRRPGDEDEEDYDDNEPINLTNDLLEVDQDFGLIKETSDFVPEITIPVSLVDRLSELLITLKDEEAQNSRLIDQIELILSSVETENEWKARRPRLLSINNKHSRKLKLNRRTSQPRRTNKKSRRRNIT